MEELKEKNAPDLLKLLSQKREALRAFRFDIAGTKIRNVKTGRNLRKEIARILTHLRARSGEKPS